MQSSQCQEFIDAKSTRKRKGEKKKGRKKKKTTRLMHSHGWKIQKVEKLLYRIEDRRTRWSVRLSVDYLRGQRHEAFHRGATRCLHTLCVSRVCRLACVKTRDETMHSIRCNLYLALSLAKISYERMMDAGCRSRVYTTVKHAECR